MKIWCTVLRENGSYKTQPIKPSKKDFTLDNKTYKISGYYNGTFLGFIPVLRAVYIEGCPDMLKINWEQYKKTNKIKLNIDAKAIKDLSDKKILSVFTDHELSKIEQIMMLVAFGSIGIGVLNLIFIMQIIEKMGGL